jgi:hypothetical protein
MTQKPYDPLDLGITPEQKGFGKRILKLSNDLSKVEFIKQVNGNTITA